MAAEPSEESIVATVSNDLSYSSDYEASLEEANDIIAGVSSALEILPVENNFLGLTMDIDYIIVNSENVVTRGTSVSGSYKSSKYDAGCAGYKYRITFDWTATINSDGDYVFDKITNPLITTYENWFVLGMAWSYYNYDITRNIYYKSDGGKSLTFETTYDFTLYDDYAIDWGFEKKNTKTIVLDSIR